MSLTRDSVKVSLVRPIVLSEKCENHFNFFFRKITTSCFLSFLLMKQRKQIDSMETRMIENRGMETFITFTSCITQHLLAICLADKHVLS